MKFNWPISAGILNIIFYDFKIFFVQIKIKWRETLLIFHKDCSNLNEIEIYIWDSIHITTELVETVPVTLLELKIHTQNKRKFLQGFLVQIKETEIIKKKLKFHSASSYFVLQRTFTYSNFCRTHWHNSYKRNASIFSAKTYRNAPFLLWFSQNVLSPETDYPLWV